MSHCHHKDTVSREDAHRIVNRFSFFVVVVCKIVVVVVVVVVNCCEVAMYCLPWH